MLTSSPDRWSLLELGVVIGQIQMCTQDETLLFRRYVHFGPNVSRKWSIDNIIRDENLKGIFAYVDNITVYGTNQALPQNVHNQ